MLTPRPDWSPQAHAALFDAARRHAAELRQQAISAFWRGAADALRQALPSPAALLRRHDRRAPCAPAIRLEP